MRNSFVIFDVGTFPLFCQDLFCPKLLLQIVECKALPTLILMLLSDDPSVHYEAVS